MGANSLLSGQLEFFLQASYPRTLSLQRKPFLFYSFDASFFLHLNFDLFGMCVCACTHSWCMPQNTCGGLRKTLCKEFSPSTCILVLGIRLLRLWGFYLPGISWVLDFCWPYFLTTRSEVKWKIHPTERRKGAHWRGITAWVTRVKYGEEEDRGKGK